jgi:hypothetical protein
MFKSLSFEHCYVSAVHYLLHVSFKKERAGTGSKISDDMTQIVIGKRGALDSAATV